jgi:hypothetical protein
MKTGGATKSDAFYVAQSDYVCGVNPPSEITNVVDIKWNGNWAFACDFKNRDIGNAQVPGDQCSNKCQQTSGCTHYTW